ncbi:MAG: ECF transporter S component [Lachnospiraceae bacterium]|jgi:riboflavin transporter FmnP|nr:ECF transporter S component [Lachnospiraceae bacterium]
METRKNIYKLTLSAMFLAIGIILPFLTGQIQQIGNMLLPMHIPVLLCGLVCGWRYGLFIGFVLPFLRYAMFGMPVLFPTGLAMAFELATYGMAIGLFYSHSRWHCIVSLYRSMVAAMLSGRVVWAVVQMLLLGIGENGFTWKMFLAGAFFNAIPGIILQLVVIPAIMVALNRTGLVHFTKTKPEISELGNE